MATLYLKEVVVAGQRVRLSSLDGKRWVYLGPAVVTAEPMPAPRKEHPTHAYEPLFGKARAGVVVSGQRKIMRSGKAEFVVNVPKKIYPKPPAPPSKIKQVREAEVARLRVEASKPFECKPVPIKPLGPREDNATIFHDGGIKVDEQPKRKRRYPSFGE